MSADPPEDGIRRLGLYELDPRLQDYFVPRVERLGYLGELIAALGHQPDALLSLMGFAGAVRAPFDVPTVEVVVLSVSSATGNRYEQYQHERLALRHGLDETWIRDVVRCRPADAVSLSEDQQVLQRLVLALVRDHGHGAQVELAAAVDAVGESAAVGVLLLTGYALLGALAANALRLPSPVQSPLTVTEAE